MSTFTFDDETFKIINEYITLEIPLDDIDPTLFDEWSKGDYSKSICVNMLGYLSIKIQIIDYEIYFEVIQGDNYITWCERFTEEMYNVIIGNT